MVKKSGGRKERRHVKLTVSKREDEFLKNEKSREEKEGEERKKKS